MLTFLDGGRPLVEERRPSPARTSRRAPTDLPEGAKVELLVLDAAAEMDAI